jgi:hypothetical protein
MCKLFVMDEYLTLRIIKTDMRENGRIVGRYVKSERTHHFILFFWKGISRRTGASFVSRRIGASVC